MFSLFYERKTKVKKWIYRLLVLIFISGWIGGFIYQRQVNSIEDLIYGSVKAPIEIVNYTSFQCPPCANFHETYADVLEKYIDSGDVKLVIKAVDLDKFEYDEVIYQHLTEEHLSDYRKLSEVYAKQSEWYALETNEEVISFLGLNESKNPELNRQIKQNEKERVKLGIKGVPTTFINVEEMELGITAEEFDARILSLLEE